MAKLTTAADKTLTIEHRFLSGVQANIEHLKGKHLRGSIWETVPDDDSDALRALMASKRMYDRDLLRRMPHNRRVVVNGYERFLFFWRRQTGAAVVSVMSPFEDLLNGDGEPQPIGLNELTEHLGKVAPNPRVRHVVGICSTTGFTEEARAARYEYPNVTLVLVEPAADGGWRITADDDVPRFVREMFDPEDEDQKTERVRREVDHLSTELLTGGLSAQQLAQRLHLPAEDVGRALEQIAEQDPELRVSGREGEKFLYRGAPAISKEKAPMSFVNRIRDLFAKEGDEVSKINVLSERRAALAQRRDRLYEDIGKLEDREADLLRQGKENTSTVVRRRLAAQIAQLRKDIARQNTAAKMLNQQINIIATNIHNLSLLQQGQMAALPSSQELTENAVRAEEMLETLKADADLVSSLETGIDEVLATSEEQDILAEFEEAPSRERAADTGRVAGRQDEGVSAEDAITAEFDEEEPAKAPPRRKPADPEAT